MINQGTLSFVFMASLISPVVGVGGESAARTADFYVARTGNDAWSGTLDQPNSVRTDGPFATLERARDAVRDLRVKAKRDVRVFIRGGIYRLPKTVVFTLCDAASPRRTISYAAYPGEQPVFSGARPVINWRKVIKPPDALPAVARSHVWIADVSDRPEFHTLFEGFDRLPCARSAGFSPINVTPRGSKEYQTVRFASGKVHAYRDVSDLELRIVPCFFWTMNLLPIDRIDLKTETLTTALPGTYPLGRNGMTDRDSAWIENGLEDLDEPGEWVRCGATGKLYYWPKNGAPESSIVIPQLTELIRVEGKIDYDGSKDQPVEGIRFVGLTFAHGDRYSWHGRTGWGLQHDWECFDKPTALVRFRGVDRCAIEDCEFTASGHTAIRLDLHCQNNRIVGNHIHHIGGAGVLLAGYGPGTKDVNRDNQVIDNHIHHIGIEYWGSGAIFAWQSGGNRIAHNLIHHIPYTAILATGRISRTPPGPGECSRTIRWNEVPPTFRAADWNQREPYLHARDNCIEYNDIHHAMQVLGDGNCVYISGAGGGNAVQYNYCHHCYGKYMNAVIRCDDDQNLTRMEGNICYRTGGSGEGFISKGDNDILNNIVADLRPEQRHRGYIVFPYGSIKGSRIQNNILYSCRRDQVLYYAGPSSKKRGKRPQLRETDMDRNLYCCSRDSHWADAHLEAMRSVGLEKQSIQADPCFKSVMDGEFLFTAKSPARQLGIQPLDSRRCGLEASYRRRFLGRSIRTHIHATDQTFHASMRVVITSDTPNAIVRFTLDGSEPVATSNVYREPLSVERPMTILARSFAPDANDLVGDRVVFTPPPEPIAEGFEDAPVGAVAPRATTNEDARKTKYVARVSDERAARGKHSLKFTCGPGQQRSYTPHIYYRCAYREGRIVGRFQVYVDADSSLSYQWRDYRKSFTRGPSVTIQSGGKIVHQGKTLLTIPTANWVRFEVASDLGGKADGHFAMRIWLPGEAMPHEFRALACDSKFRRLDWVGVTSQAKRPASYYIDDFVVQPSREQEQ